jgi:hypothetical protein
MKSKNDSQGFISLEELVRRGALVDEPTKCKILGESLSKSRRDRLFGRGVPWVKRGRQVRFDPRDIAAHIAASKHGHLEPVGLQEVCA